MKGRQFHDFMYQLERLIKRTEKNPVLYIYAFCMIVTS